MSSAATMASIGCPTTSARSRPSMARKTVFANSMCPVELITSTPSGRSSKVGRSSAAKPSGATDWLELAGSDIAWATRNRGQASTSPNSDYGRPPTAINPRVAACHTADTNCRPGWARSRAMSTDAKTAARVGPRYPHLVVLVGATGDLSRRKLLPGLFHLASSGFIPGCRIIGVSLDSLDADGFRTFARAALDEFSQRKIGDDAWLAFAQSLDYVPLSAGVDALKEAAQRAEQTFTGESRRLHYLSVPPNAALSAARMLAEANLIERSRVVMEKPFGTDLASAVALNAKLHEVFSEQQIFRIDHFLGKEPAQNILAFRFGNGLFEPIWNRNFIDHVQIDVPETLGLGKRTGFYETVGAFRDMVVTHLFQILAFTAMEPPTSLEPTPISEEKNKVFRSLVPIRPNDVVRGQYIGYRAEEGVHPESD